MLLQALCIISKASGEKSLNLSHGDFFVPCDLEIWRMTLKTIDHLFYATSSLVHHFIAISELKLELWSGNTQFGSKLVIFFILCDLEIWQLTLKNNKAPRLCYFKLCASFQSISELKHELHSGNALFGTKLAIFCTVGPTNLTNDFEK